MAAAQALRDQIASVYGQVTRLNALAQTREEVFAAATASAEEREAQASQNFGDRVSLLTAARVPALNAPRLTPEQKLAAELQLYRREEAERLQAIARHEEDIKGWKAKLVEAEREYGVASKTLAELRQSIKHREVSTARVIFLCVRNQVEYKHVYHGTHARRV